MSDKAYMPTRTKVRDGEMEGARKLEDKKDLMQGNYRINKYVQREFVRIANAQNTSASRLINDFIYSYVEEHTAVVDEKLRKERKNAKRHLKKD